MPQNFIVTRGQFGAYPVGSVLPRYAVEAAAGAAPPDVRAAVVADLVERGILAPTGHAVNVELRLPAPAEGGPPVAVPPAVTAELNALREAKGAIEAERDRLAAQLAESKAACEALRAEIADYVEENGHLRAACDEHQKASDDLAAKNQALAEQVAALTKELDDATAPAKG